jgi:hypothetical protein
MSILTSNEILEALPKITSERQRFDLAAGMKQALEKACNRVFPSRVGQAVTVSQTTTLTVPRHGLRVTDQIRLASSDPSANWNGTFSVLSVPSLDTFTISLTPSVAFASAGEVTMRRVITEVQDTQGGNKIACTYRPVSLVVSVEVSDASNVFQTALDSSLVMLDEDVQGVSYSGFVELRNTTLPYRANKSWREGGRFPRGVRIKYVAGEPTVPADLFIACKRAVAEMVRREEQGGLTSESYDYYSYTMGSAEELSKHFGELSMLIRHYRLPVI